MQIVRQGDVLLVPVSHLPDGCVLAQGQSRKIVLALGEATGHHHRIEDHVIGPEAAAEIAEAAIARARLYVAPNGDRFLDVSEPVTLLHEEHESVALPPGLYEIPVQMEYDESLMREVQD
jgi:hypothetical protein